MQRLAPHLPLMIARIGIKLHLHPTVMHLLHNVTCVFNTWILLTTAQEEHIKLLIECVGVGQHAGYH